MAEESNGNSEAALTRREAREAFQARNGARIPLSRSAVKSVVPATAVQPSAPPVPKRRIKRFANVFVLLAAAGIVGTIAIPAYAFNPGSQGQAAVGSTVIDTMKRANAQSADVATAAMAPNAARESFQATSTDEIAAQKAAAAAAQLASKRAAAAAVAAKQAAAYQAAYSGPTAAQYVTAPVYNGAGLSKVVTVAEQYIGTPYVYGGSTPAGFDCSGFVMFVYAQFGVSLPHSSSAQGHIGQTVSLDQAQPGDVIALDNGSHDGFYAGRDAAGNVLILDAPKPGGHVGVRTLWTTAYHIQHYGIPG
ncbi:MAG TPA: C40 family peptidase [Gryllotalpicola sp.]